VDDEVGVLGGIKLKNCFSSFQKNIFMSTTPKQTEQYISISISKEEYDSLRKWENECIIQATRIQQLTALNAEKDEVIATLSKLIIKALPGGAGTSQGSIAPQTPVFFGNNFQAPQVEGDNQTKKAEVKVEGQYKDMLEKALAQAQELSTRK
jgi:hypothetical protein